MACSGMGSDGPSRIRGARNSGQWRTFLCKVRPLICAVLPSGLFGFAGALEVVVVLTMVQGIKNDACNARQMIGVTQQNAIAHAQLQAGAGDFVFALIG